MAVLAYQQEFVQKVLASSAVVKQTDTLCITVRLDKKNVALPKYKSLKLLDEIRGTPEMHVESYNSGQIVAELRMVVVLCEYENPCCQFDVFAFRRCLSKLKLNKMVF